MVAGYYPKGTEISPLSALKHIMILPNKSVALPVVTGNNQPLLFREYNQGTVLQSGAFGILEPDETARILIPDIVIVPFLAFDEEGFRLGYGGGFYDRTLQALRQNNPDLLTIGVGYSKQKAAGVLPIDSYDQKLDFIVTNTAEYRF